MKKLLVLGDSLSLPRELPEICSYENTWPQLLKRQFNVHQVSIGGATIKELVRQLEYHKAFRPDIVVLQSGIVDCAPRALSKMELDFFSHYKVLRKLVLPMVQRRATTIRRYRRKTYTKISEFSAALKDVEKKLPGSKLYALSILPANDAYELIVPGITDSIRRYNEVLKSTLVERYISLDQMDPSGIMSDHIHLNEKGHADVYNYLLNVIL